MSGGTCRPWFRAKLNYHDSVLNVWFHAEALRGVFQKLLGNPASRQLMKQLLAGAELEFNENAFEAQVREGFKISVEVGF
jgi:hypothetical protein